MTIANVLSKAFAKPAESEMNFIERKVYAAEDMVKPLVVRWYLFVPMYGFLIEAFKG